MKKQKEIKEDDPIDGTKMLGCLFAGIVIFAILLSVGSWIIHQLR
jgi:hypothetical protein